MSDDATPSAAGAADAGLTVRVRFKLEDERGARQLAARLIDRAHELANLPECECDLDVEVEWLPAPTHAGGAAASSVSAAGNSAADPAAEPGGDRDL